MCYQGQDSLEGQGCTPCPGDQVSWNGGRCVEPESSERACGVAQRVWETGSCVDHWSNWACGHVLETEYGEENLYLGYMYWTGGRNFWSDCCEVGGGHYPNAYCTTQEYNWGPPGM